MGKQKFYGLFYAVSAYLIIFIQPSVAQWVVQDDGCRTPDRGVGSCIRIHSCQPIMNFMNQMSSPIPPEVAEVLRGYWCGSEGNEVKVCCPSGPIPNDLVANIYINSSPGGTNSPPDVSGHRNLNLLPERCGISDLENKISGGTKTELYEFPWMALVSYRTNRGPNFRCGGTIINNRYILTAAHCLTNLKDPILGVRIGEYNVKTKVDCQGTGQTRICSPPHQDFGIERVIPHPGFNRTSLTDDIGLIRLQSTMNLSVENAKPICLPLDDQRLHKFGNEKVFITGWGVTERGIPSDELLKIAIPVLSNEDCSNRYKGVVTITDKQMCAYDTNGSRADSCPGDSGGPLQAFGASSEGDAIFIQHGVVSYGPKFCGNPGSYPGVYTRVAYYMDWILDNMQP